MSPHAIAQADIKTAYPFVVRTVPHPPHFFEQDKRRSFSPERSKQIRDRLEALDHTTGAMFQTKPMDAKPPFRLLINNLDGHDNTTKSFVALSYCWHNIRQWKPVSGCKLGSSQYHKRLPISDPCFREVLKCLNPREGVWIDQLCINQANMKEKAEAIASMDLVYRNARLVIIVLEDIELTKDETSLATELRAAGRAKSTDDFKAIVKTRPRDVWGMVSKIGSSRWFRRAWCVHEFHLCRDATFVIPCRQRRSAMSLGLGAFHEILMLKSDWLPASMESRTWRLKGYQTAVLLLSTRFVVFWQHVPDPPVIGICYLVNSLEASRPCDKVSIALNLLGLRLSFRGRVLSDARSQHIFTLLALASGDPLTLCCTGKALNIGGKRCKRAGLDISCLQWPDPDDLVHVNNRYPKAAPTLCDAIGLEGGRMKMNFFVIREMGREPSAADMSQARRLVCALFRQDPYILAKLEPEEFTHPILDPNEFFENSVNYLACALHLGPAWISEALGNIGCSPVAQGLRACLKTNLGDAFTHTVREHWASTSGWDKYPESSFVDFISFALQHVLQLGSTAQRITTVSSFSSSGSWGAMVSLPMDYDTTKLVGAVPTMLGGAGHSFIKRLWLLEMECDKISPCRIWGKGYIWGYKEMEQSCEHVVVSM